MKQPEAISRDLLDGTGHIRRLGFGFSDVLRRGMHFGGDPDVVRIDVVPVPIDLGAFAHRRLFVDRTVLSTNHSSLSPNRSGRGADTIPQSAGFRLPAGCAAGIGAIRLPVKYLSR